MGIPLHQLPRHILDSLHEALRVVAALGDLRQAGFPFSGEQRRFQHIRQDDSEIDAVLGRHKTFALALDKSGREQLFNHRCPRCRSSQPLPLCILRHILLARVLHCGQKRILGVGLGRRGIMLGNRSRDRFKNLPLGKLRQRHILCAVLVRLCFERGAETGVNVFPARNQNRFALGGERLAAAVKGRRNGFILLRRCNGAQQLAADKGHQLLFALRQSVKAVASKSSRRDNRVVVGNLGAVDDAPNLRRKLRALHKGKHRQQRRNKVGCRLRHILGEIIAVSTGIGQKTLFIQALRIVKGLLGGKAVNAVGFPLQQGKVKELRRQRGFLLLFERNANGLRRFASRFQRIRSGSVGNTFAFRVHAAAADMHDVVFLLVEHRNFSVALHQQIQRR